MAERTAVVVGGGIGGLAAAVALHRCGWRVTVLERAAEFAEIGAGLSLWPNGMRALDALGLADRVRAAGAVETAGGVRSRSGRWLSKLDNAEIARRHGWPLVVVRRADLLSVLADSVPAATLQPGTEVSTVYAGSGLVEHRRGTLRADLVVGADGVGSGLRRRLWPAAGPARYAGYTAWRMISEPLPEPPPTGAVIWGRGERIGYTALPGGRFYCFGAATVPAGTVPAGTVPADAASPRGEHEALRHRFGNWPAPVPELLGVVPQGSVLRHDVYVAPPLPSYVSGRVALLGDAAHAMDPILGQGACQALEDAVTLAACLHASPDTGRALAEYDRLRRPRTRAVARRSARLGAVAQWSAPAAAAARDLVSGLVPAGAVLRSMAPVLGWRPPRARA